MRSKTVVLRGFAAAALAMALLAGCRTRQVGLGVGIDLQRPQAVMQAPYVGFRSGENFRLRVTPSQDCYVYVLHEGTDGSWAMLFPRTEVESGKNFCRIGLPVQIPSVGWFQFDDQPGIERLIILACRKHIGEIEAFRNRPLAAQEAKALLMQVEETYNTRVVKRAEVRRVDHVYHIVATRDEFPVLNFNLDLVHQ